MMCVRARLCWRHVTIMCTIIHGLNEGNSFMVESLAY
jgi:hypothetical protein